MATQPDPSTCFLTPENSLVILLDYQPRTIIAVRSMDPQTTINNSVYLAKAAAALQIPAILSTIHRKNSGDLHPGIGDCFPGVVPIDRASRNAWSDPGFLAAVRKADRRKLVLAGLLTEVCLCFTTLSALEAGYEAYIVIDASGGTSIAAHEAAIQRMVQAGATPVSVQQVVSEYAEGAASPQRRAALVPIIERHAGGFGQMFIFKEHISSESRNKT